MEPGQTTNLRRRFTTCLLIVAAYAAAVYLPWLGSAHTLTQHEGFIATTALNMLDRGDWLLPRYGNWTRIEKPPAYNWICAGLFRLTGGMSETAERLPAALSAIGLCLAVAILGHKLYGDRAGLLAGLIQTTCIWAFLQGRLGENDMPLTLLLTIAHGALLWRWGGGEDRLSLLAAVTFWSAIGLAAMFKGAAALPFPALTVLAWCLVRRNFRPLREVLFTPAVLCFVAIAAPWHVYVASQLGNEAFERWGYNSAARVLGEHHLGSDPPWFYVMHIPWLMLPWTIALAVNARVLMRDATRGEGHTERFLWTWFFAGLVFLSLAAFKHKHYCYPLLPPLAILCAKLVSGHIELLGRRGRVVYGTIFAIALVGYGVASATAFRAVDHWAPSLRFVRDKTRGIPPEAELYAVGLGNSPVYPYIARRYEYLDGIPSVREVLQLGPQREIWILALGNDAESSPDVSLDPLWRGPRGRGHPLEIVIGRAWLRTSTQSSPSR